MQSFKPKRSIRWELAAAFTAVACFVAAFVGVAIAIHLQTLEHAAQLEAGHDRARFLMAAALSATV